MRWWFVEAEDKPERVEHDTIHVQISVQTHFWTNSLSCANACFAEGLPMTEFFALFSASREGISIPIVIQRCCRVVVRTRG